MATDRRLLVIEAKITNDLRACRVGGANGGAAVQQPIRLEEICGTRDVGRNNGVIRTERSNTVNLYGEDYGNGVAFPWRAKRKTSSRACETRRFSKTSTCTAEG